MRDIRALSNVVTGHFEALVREIDAYAHTSERTSILRTSASK
jgi:hypothetical protein